MKYFFSSVSGIEAFVSDSQYYFLSLDSILLLFVGKARLFD